MSPHQGGTAVDVVRDERETKPSTICKHCDRDLYVHMAEGKCPFEASSFEPYLMGDLVDRTLAAMGRDEIKAKLKGFFNVKP